MLKVKARWMLPDTSVTVAKHVYYA
jgi:hypothetical protein